MQEKLKLYLTQNKEAIFETLRELCAIPAPSHHEEARAAYCLEFFERIGAKGAYIDEAKNVIFPLGCEGKNSLLAVVAHTDTVFPDLEPLPYSEDETYIYCPGVSDNTASLSVLLYVAKYFVEEGITPKNGILFVCNSCEEGLGNLKGVRQLFADYKGRIARFISFDSAISGIADRAVGSHRYRVVVETPGGHSYGAFGAKNAINELAGMIREIYTLEVPEKAGAKTTYNVGGIEGGTSVNTIAQSASMLCEYRSDDEECLSTMQKAFESIFAAARREDVKVTVELIGERPCSITPKEEVDALRAIPEAIVKDVLGIPEVHLHSSSTDCNIPLSLGVPAVCIGVRESYGIHTREERLLKSSLIPGLEIGLRTMLALSE